MSDPPRLEPRDAWNLKLEDEVRPAGWKNPEPEGTYDLVVLGAGTAGLVTAAATAGLGGRVALVERHLMGGDCLNVGCVPSKAVLRASRAWAEAGRLDELGLDVKVQRRDFGAVMERMRRLRAEIAPVDGATRFRDLGVDVHFGHGRFVSPRELEVGGQRLRFNKAVIATGGRPFVPPVPGIDEVPFRTNETIFSLTLPPRRLAVVGGGPIGCELAQAFARFGCEVTMIFLDEHVLPREDADAAEVVRRSLGADGVRFEPRARLAGLAASETGRKVLFERDGATHALEADEILLAIGRTPNVEELGLEAAGIEFDRKGVRVDDRLRTTNGRVFAAGDVASRYQFTHAADAMARMVVQNAFFLGRLKASSLIVPWCTYTAPEVAHVGRTERELKADGVAFEAIHVPIDHNDRALLDGATEGFLKVLHPPGKGTILGATLVAEHAGESIGQIVLAMQGGLGLAELSSTILPYPTQAAVIRRAGDEWRRKKLTPIVKRALDARFGRLRARPEG